MNFYGMEKLSLVDFDGYVAATVFTGNCNFICPFCHNSSLVLDYKNLEQLKEEEIISYLEKRKGIIEGLCITGGEPTLNTDLPNFCEKIKKMDLAVKVDTNGTNTEMVKTLNENGLADYFAMDIKNDKENYGKIIGIENYNTNKIEKTVDYFINNVKNFEFRTTAIKEFHNADNFERIGQWIKGAKKYFIQKFINSENCITNNLHEIENDKAQEFLSVVSKYVINAKLRGYDIK